MLPRISITWMLAACGGDAASDKGGQGDDSAAPDEIIETGGFALAASVVGPDGAPSPESGLCAAAVDLSGAAWGNPSPAILAEAPVSGDGDVLLEIASVPSGATLGIGILIEACGEEAVMPTLSPIPATAWAWAGPGDTVLGLQAFVYTFADVASLQGELAASGFGGDLATEGFLAGTLVNEQGLALNDCWVRGPAGTASWYDQGEATWVANEGTQDEGGGRYVVPSPPFGSYLGRGAARDFPPFLGAGFPGYAERVDYAPID